MNIPKTIHIVLNLMFGLTLPLLAQNNGSLRTSSTVTTHYSECPFGSPVACDSRSFTTNLYDGHGNLVQSFRFGFDSNGTVVEWTVANSVYDAQRKPLVRVEERDYDADGRIDSRITTLFSYPGARQTRQFTALDIGANGTVEQTTATTTTSNQRGDPVLEVVEATFYAEGSTNVTTTTTTRDQHGDPLFVVIQSDSNADGTVDFQLESKWIYDDRHNRIFYYEDQSQQTPSLTYTTDNERNPLSVAGVVGGVGFTGTYKYDNQGNLIEGKFALALPNGASAPITATLTAADSYAHRGELLRNSASNAREIVGLRSDRGAPGILRWLLSAAE